MPRYTVGSVPTSAAGFRGWIAEELRRVADALNRPETLELETTAAAPARPRNGMILYADGVAWNPGSGAGFYGFEGGAWVKL
jgi:hypothetical protein